MKRHSSRRFQLRGLPALLLAVAMLLPVWVATAYAGEARTPWAYMRDPLGPIWIELEPTGATLEMQGQSALGGLFGAELRENFGSQLGVVGWSDDGSEFVVRGVSLTPDQIYRIRERAQRLGLTAQVVATELEISEQKQLSDLIREQVLHALPSEVGWAIGIDLDTQRVGVEVEGYADLAALNNAVRGVSEEFVRTLELERTAIDSPALAQIDAGDLYYVAGAELYPVDWRDTLHARGGEWLGGLDGICTSGFLFRSGSSYRLSTAGHCARGDDWDGDIGGSVGFLDENGVVTGTSIGTVTDNLFEDGGTDVALMTLSALSTTVSRVTTSANTYRDVTGIRAEADLMHNDEQCFVGWGIHSEWNKDKKCGPQKKEDVTVHPSNSPSGYEIEGLYCLERRTTGGDSGGPVYYESGSDAIAAGTVAFSMKKNSLFTTTKWYTWASSIGRCDRVQCRR